MGTRGVIGDKWSMRILWACAIGSAVGLYMVAVERQQQNRDRMMAESLNAMESEGAFFHRALVLSILLPSTRKGMPLIEGFLNSPNVPNQISVAGVTALNDGLNHLNSTIMADSNPSSDQKLGVINSSSIDDHMVHSASRRQGCICFYH
ncbi:hypothetical protein GQ457_07G014510 [Hibiscus cannabinus]